MATTPNGIDVKCSVNSSIQFLKQFVIGLSLGLRQFKHTISVRILLQFRAMSNAVPLKVISHLLIYCQIIVGSKLTVHQRLYCMNSIVIVSLQLCVQNAVSAQPCVGKLGISLVLLNFLDCNFRWWFETP